MKLRNCLLFLLLIQIFSFNAKGQNISDFSTELPLIIINTNGKTIVDEPKITTDMKIVSNESGLNKYNDTVKYNGRIRLLSSSNRIKKWTNCGKKVS